MKGRSVVTKERIWRHCAWLLVLLSTQFTAGAVTVEKMMLDQKPELRREAEVSKSLPELKAKANVVTIDGQRFYVAEGDLLLDEDQLQFQAIRQDWLEKSKFFGVMQSTVSITVDVTPDGKTNRWEPGKILTYCVLRKTFPDKAKYDQVVQNMKQATAAWEGTCGIKFQYLAQFDNDDGIRPAGVLFPVRQIDVNGAFIAQAFFPSDGESRRRILLDPSYFSPNLKFDRVGVLRHELGHVIGFRHEHIRSGAPPECPTEEEQRRRLDLTRYDPKSVMHYFCGNVGSRELAITEVDREGAQRLYGAPLAQVQPVR